ncbi:hypothetical protein DV532_30095 (plasmid) [Pseudomonas sp. Leaf58]|uniref:hypothetical protein n=1 Tax=unclassified Pseudomonas TaxID=196821 RepID=UPI0007006D8E|nr:hypothetical protein [Pseudomonas sp. Leaf58]AYG48481.1 hypothetical protein DV532_30095 [Pseudomonas sp. Leaf58]KQN61975.1 hypothetical protein ASF02_07240 [Pseudomonas sp. Leaf58]
MKKSILGLLAATAIPFMVVSTPSHASTEAPAAATQAPASTQTQAANFKLSLVNPVTHQAESLSISQITNADKMREFIVPLPNAAELYDTYVSKGYLPLHAMILTSWDVNEIMRSVSPSLPDNPAMREKIAGIHKIYQPAQ